MGCPTRTGLAGLSRFVRHRHVVPRLAAGTNDFLEAVERVVVEGNYQLVFACSDAEIIALSRERERISARMPYADHETMLGAIDKIRLGHAAKAAGMATPPVASSVAEARERWGADATIVKESLHGTLDTTGHISHLAPESFTDPTAAEQRVEEIQAAGGVPVLQPFIAGRLMAFSSVVDGSGQMLARVQQVAERTYPREAGLSVRARTIAIDEELAELVSRLLRVLHWFGLSELQFILPTEGAPVLLDFNGRFYGSLALALAADVNLPDIWARIATGREPSQTGDARPGVRYQWLEGDLRAARECSRGPLRNACECVRYAMGANGSIWSASDPLPGLLAAGTVLSQAARVAAKGAKPPVKTTSEDPSHESA
jgi:predicted ATP-grasp superfamily ATP-dependent carboligase